MHARTGIQCMLCRIPIVEGVGLETGHVILVKKKLPQLNKERMACETEVKLELITSVPSAKLTH